MNPDIQSIPLRDIHLPESVSWWPLAPGWWITLGLFLMAALVVYFLKFMKERQQTERQVLDEFEKLVDSYKTNKEVNQLLVNVSQLLRRVSITRFEDEDVAGLTGNSWLKFLDDVFSDVKSKPSFSFQGELGELLVSGQYQKSSSIDENKLDQLLILSKAWLLTVSKQISNADNWRGISRGES